VILALLAPAALRQAALALALMLLGTAAAVLLRPAFAGLEVRAASETDDGARPLPALRSPFSLSSALRFGAVFLALQVAGTLAHRALGRSGFYAVSLAGGVVSSASAVASAATLAAAGTLSPHVAAVGAIIASGTSALISLPILARVAREPRLTRAVGLVLGIAIVLGLLGTMLQFMVSAR
jgi:uncharacterized membrane protein (DUF4010 family)